MEVFDINEKVMKKTLSRSKNLQISAKTIFINSTCSLGCEKIQNTTVEERLKQNNENDFY